MKSIVSTLTIWMLLGFCSLYGQAQMDNYIPQEPNAQALARAIDFPVSHYTGLPNISIPLYDIELDGLQIPISLSYHASGILASQEATSVGLGWTLNAGGMITRTVRGGDDFHTHQIESSNYTLGYFGGSGWGENPFDSPDYFMLTTKPEPILIKDSEPDIYFYSLPTCSGKFFFTRDTVAVLVNRPDNVRIEVLENGRRFRLTDGFGNIYKFEHIEETRTFSINDSVYSTNSSHQDFDITNLGRIGYNFTETAQYNSSWFLNEIITAKNDTIEIEYIEDKSQTPLRETLRVETLVSHEANSSYNFPYDYLHDRREASKTLISGWLVSSIRWKGNQILFTHEDREDLHRYGIDDNLPQRITGFTIRNNQGDLVKSYQFHQSYFFDGLTHENPHLYKRLRLDSITDVLADNSHYSFGYYGSSLVPKNTHNTDYWGFPNGSLQGEAYQCPVYYQGTQYSGGNKSPNLYYTLDGTLQSITYPTRGHTSFEYELNSYMEPGKEQEVNQTSSISAYIGPAVEHYDNLPSIATDTIVLSFKQDLHVEMSYCYVFENRDSVPSGYDRQAAYSIIRIHDDGHQSVVMQREVLEDIQSLEISQKDTIIKQLEPGTYFMQVKALIPDYEFNLTCRSKKMAFVPPHEENGGGLRIKKISGPKVVEYKYHDPLRTIKPVTNYLRGVSVVGPYATFQTFLVQFSESIRPLSTIKNGNIFGYGMVEESFSDGTKTTYRFHNEQEDETIPGYPLLSTIPNWYNGCLESKTIVSPNGASQRTDYIYNLHPSTHPMQGMVCEPYGPMFTYSYNIQNPLERRTEQTETYADGSSFFKETNTLYNVNLLPTSVREFNSADNYIKEITYASEDNTNSNIAEKMLERNMVSVPIETRQKKGTILINGERTKYMLTADNLIVPQCKYSFSSGQPFGYDTIFYSSYTPKGHPQQLNLHNSVQTVLWDQTDTYPIAVLQNQPFCTGLSADLPRLRESFPDAHITTSSYIPLVGVTDIIDSRGYKKTFTYDRAGRFCGSFYEDESGADCAVQNIKYHYSDAIDPQNYVSTTTYIEKDRSDSLMKVEFFDGFSRPTTTSVQGLTMDGSYLSSHVQYDANGRVSRSWLPINSSSPFQFSNQSIPEQSSVFYGDGKAYSDIEYDFYDRKTFISTPGDSWSGKGTTVSYGANQHEEVRRYHVADNSLISRGYYPAGSLLKETKTDEDSITVSIFTNLAGKVILQRKEGLDTYYAYDNHDNLRLVLSPVASDSLSQNGNWSIATNTILNRYCYYYEYDLRNRCIKKKLPGCAPVTYKYDNANHIISEQDGVLLAMRKTRHYRYDSFDRMTEQYLSSDNRQDDYTEIHQWYDGYNFLDSLSAYFSGNILDSLSYEGITDAKGLLTGKLQRTSDDLWFADIFFYDELGRIKRHQTLHEGNSIQSSKIEYNNIGDVKREQVSYNVINSGTNLIIDKTYQYYPQSQKLWHKNAVIHTQAGADSITQTFSYDCLGNLVHTDRDGDAADMDYQYDMVHGWLKQIDSQNGFQQKLHREEGATIPRFNGSISAMEWKVPRDRTSRKYNYEYDSSNRLIKAKYSEMPGLPTPGFMGLGSNSPSDNLGNVSLLSLLPSPQPGMTMPGIYGADRYTEKIQYDKNSNIKSLQRYGRNNRGTYGLIDDLVIEYVGNQRTKVTDNAPALSYEGSSDFVDVQDIDAIEYCYDFNGSLTKDKNRNIDSIYYDNSGNLQRIRFSRVPNEGLAFTERENLITYVYTVDGQKLKTSHLTTNYAGTYQLSMTATSTDYVGNLILKDGHPEMLRLDDGYVSFDSDTISGIHYYIQDYMGNNRVVVNGRTDSVEQVTHYYPYGGIIGDISTNESLQRFKFEGKELDRTFGLDNYDIHARQYFAMAPMWDRPDTKAEDYYGISPYVYCGGDPINLVDYNGRETRIYIETTGVGHTFITTGEGKGTTVYTYGRYGQLGKNKSVLRNLTPTGEGVLLILKGEGAHDYINKEIDKGAMIFSFSNVDEKSIDSHFSEIFQNSSDQPSNGKYKESNNAHVVDEYNVISNNCTTTALDALQSTGANTVQYWSNIPAMLKTNLSLLVEIQKIEEYFSKKKPTINIVEPDEIESEYEDY